MWQGRGAGTDEGDIASNNNSGHIVVENSENNNIGSTVQHNNEEDNNDGAQQDRAESDPEGDLWLTEDEDEDENYADEDCEENSDSLLRVPVPLSDLPDTVTVLEKNGCLVYLVGTVHFSKESQDDVTKVIQLAKPHVIMVELCQSRVNILKMDEAKILSEAKNINISAIRQVIQRNGVMQGVLNILLLNMSAYITKELGMAPGGEFRVAFNEARRLKGGCKFVLGDRPIQVTLRRALASLSVWQRIKLAYAILFSKEPITKEDVEKCKQKDMLEQMIEEMTGEFPALGRVFVRERDVYLAHSLRNIARPIPCPDAPEGMIPSVVVGVVGIGHVQGIQDNWDKELDIEEICRLPETSTLSKLTKWGIRLGTLSLLTYGCYKVTKLTMLPWISAVIK